MLTRFAVVTIAILQFSVSRAHSNEIIILDGLPGAHPVGFVEDVSPDGEAVVGIAPNGPFGQSRSQEASRWTSSSGMVSLGLIADDIANTSYAFGASHGGHVVVGSAHGLANGTYGNHAFRWTETEGMEIIEFPSFWEVQDSSANGVSGDGTVIVGSLDSANQTRSTFAWNANSGLTTIEDLPGGRNFGAAYGVSADGKTIVGMGESGHGLEAFRWTEQTGTVPLGDLPGGEFRSGAAAVSADGSVIVGVGHSIDSGTNSEAFRWTAANGIIGLGDLPGGEFMSVAEDTTADGAIVVGHAMTGAGQEAFIWDAANGMRSLRDVLVDEYGMSSPLDGWMLSKAKAISADGRVLVGEGIGPNGLGSWMVRLDSAPVPEPATITLVAVAVLMISLRTKRRFRRSVAG